MCFRKIVHCFCFLFLAISSTGLFAQEAAGTRVYRSSLKYHVMFETIDYQEAVRNLNYSSRIETAWKSVGINDNSIPIYRCVILGSYKGQEHFASTDINCEGQKREGIYGYAYRAQLPGTSPLVRAYCHDNEYGESSHITFDSDVKFRNSGYNNGCYHIERTLGYVFESPIEIWQY